MERGLGRDAREGITTAMHSPNETRMRSIFSKRATEFGDQGRQADLRHERVGPQPLIQFVFGNDAGAMGDESVEQIERLRGEVDRLVLPR